MNSPSSSTAGPSNPARLLVKSRDLASASFSSTAAASSAVKASLARKSDHVRKAEKWGDRMMEQTMSPKDFKRGLKYITPSAYAEIEHERHLNHLCSYPPCPNSPRREYRQGPRYSISTTLRSIKEVEGNREDGFCSAVCRKRSEWVAKQLDRKRQEHGGEEGEITLLEEMPGESEAATGVTKKSAGGGTLRPGARLRDRPAPGGENGAIPKPIATMPELETLVGEITIHERPTPSVPPPPPSLSPSASTQDPKPTTKPPLAYGHRPASAPSRRAAGSALVPTPTKLVSSILSSSRQNPGRQMEAESDSSESSLDPEEENPLGMGGWSEDEDVRALFEEARAARELINDDSQDEGSKGSSSKGRW